MSEAVNENTTLEQDGFFTVLKALKQVVQPGDQLDKQVHILQKENRTLFEKLENLRQESQEELRAVRQESLKQLDELRKEWEQKLQAEKEQAQRDRSEFEADLVQKTARLKKIEAEKRLIVERVEEERRELEESMIQLETENNTLKERCIKSESMGAKLQAEVR